MYNFCFATNCEVQLVGNFLAIFPPVFISTFHFIKSYLFVTSNPIFLGEQSYTTLMIRQ